MAKLKDLKLNDDLPTGGGATIDDAVPAVDKAYSSSKVVSLIPDALADLSEDTTHRVVTDTEKTKLAGIATGADVNVQADWDAVTGDAQILNKPIILTISGLSKITVSTIEPTTPLTNDLWVDTN
jgi:hypothetical protein